MFFYGIGPEKCGSHLIVKALRLFVRAPKIQHRHIWQKEIYDEADKVVLIIRNPRNALFSYLRWVQRERNTENACAVMETYVSEYFKYIPMLRDPDVCVVKFEELLSDDKVIAKIGEFVGLEMSDNHFYNLWGDTRTFTNDLTDWRKFWTEEINAAWTACGGVELEYQLSYDVNKYYKRIKNG